MKHFLILIVLFTIASCTDEKKDAVSQKTQKNIWPQSTEFTGNGNSFIISLTKELDDLSFKQSDTLKTLYGKAIQDVYSMENDSISLTISLARYNEQVMTKRKPEKLIESAMNTFLHTLKAQKTQSMICSKNIMKSSVSGVRTFYTILNGMTRYYGASEMYIHNGALYHIAILSTKKNAFSESQSVSLAFHSFMPQ
jgi:hypothetical protein